MTDARRSPHFDIVTAVVGILLLGLAGVLVWDAASLSLATPYGMGPQATPYLIAGGLVALAVGHLISAVRNPPVTVELADPVAVAWVFGGFVALIAIIGLDGGFVLATALLFAATARGFGRRAFVMDLAIGFVLGVVIYLAFTKLLTLSLPQGPLERLL